MATIKRLRLWQIIVIIGILILGFGGGTYVINAQLSGSQAAEGLTENEQLVAVTRGDLINQVQTGGTLTLPHRESIRLGAGSIVKDVLVEEGQAVIEGQALFTLDDATVAQHDMEIAKARIALRDAQDALANLLPDAQADLAAAEDDITDGERILGDLDKEHRDKIDTAQDAVDEQQELYRDIFAAWLGVTLEEHESSMPPNELLTRWGANLKELLIETVGADSVRGVYSRGAPADDPTTRWSETIVYGIVNFYPGQIVATCESTDAHPLNGHCLQKGFDDAWDALTTARDNLDSAVTARDTVIKDAQTKLDAAREERDRMLLAVRDASEGNEGYARQLKEAELATAQVALQDALQQREEATVRAPIDGIVAVLNAVPGEELDVESRIAVEIIDTSTVELSGQVDETDVLRISYGDPAEITLDAMPRQVFTGSISSISSAAQLQQGIAVFTVLVRIDVPPDVDLREGMNANARMAVEEEFNVLLVPVQSIYGTFQEPILRVMSDGETTSRPVTLGGNDGFWVVIDSGASEGEEVIMHVSEADEFGVFGGGPGFQRQTTRTVRVVN
ncbi:MAG: HlyD family efflux transporter periplasmic adaptor subunit [Dehalococcoidia bacterium]|nr:HlyD family efflux transporter periplasmic adaptor subunit [Dehalococcoidia bacterium]